ncbi:ribbon-helix-helix protein, CopG family [Phytohabitans suffuscus]|nr:ribbon-helix-helix protein, CopG family [Phytohabitans suffuscus]
MSRDDVLAWFDRADDISPVIATMDAAPEPVRRAAGDGPMMLASIRLPVATVEQLDALAELDGVRRSDIVREALAAYLRDRTSPVGRDEAERALDVLRRVVAGRGGAQVEAA